MISGGEYQRFNIWRNVVSGDFYRTRQLIGRVINMRFRFIPDISNQLITNIFIPNTPLHNGAWYSWHKIAAAACCRFLRIGWFRKNWERVTDAPSDLVSERCDYDYHFWKRNRESQRDSRKSTVIKFKRIVEEFYLNNQMVEDQGRCKPTIVRWSTWLSSKGSFKWLNGWINKSFLLVMSVCTTIFPIRVLLDYRKQVDYVPTSLDSQSGQIRLRICHHVDINSEEYAVTGLPDSVAYDEGSSSC